MAIAAAYADRGAATDSRFTTVSFTSFCPGRGALVDISPTRRPEQAPVGMVEIPEGEFEFVVQGLEVEGDNAIGVDVAYPWEDSPRRFHAHKLAMNRFYMDRFPVTNKQFKQFLDASGYRPAEAKNYLKDWVDGTVSAHLADASPFSVMDMVGNVWQWTDEFVDEHTRAAVVRGGSYYQPQGSAWYFPRAYRNDQHGIMLLMAPGKDRAATVGFRCVVDAKIRGRP